MADLGAADFLAQIVVSDNHMPFVPVNKELPMSDTRVQDAVREKYGEIARSVGKTGCCGPAARGCGDPITSDLYSDTETAGLPDEAVAVSLGCGNPTALINLQPGQTVLDLGSGGGIDVLLSAKRVGPTGKVYGLDMTDDMLSLARENQRKARATNVEFLKGTIETIPLPDNSVDVIISNCVINLSVDKDAVLREAFRVLKPGGRFAVTDVVILGDVPSEVRRSLELWVGCVAGALRDEEYVSKLHAAGFADAELDPWRAYQVSDARAFLAETGVNVDEIAPQVDGKVASAFIRARKPEATVCCGPTCCS
jgi:arsenite methyltransferase